MIKSILYFVTSLSVTYILMLSMQQRAAEASAAQNKFWQMHDYLFEHQDALDDIHLSNYAKKMDLDIGKFKKEMKGHVYASLIDHSLKSGIDSGVEGTPTFFVNGVPYEDSWDLDTFSKFLKKTLNT